MQSFGGGAPSLRLFNTTDDQHDDYCGQWSSNPAQMNLADTQCICFFNDSDETGNTVQPYLALPLLDTVPFGTIYCVRNMCRGRSTYVRPHASETSLAVFIYEGIVDNENGDDLFNKLSYLTADTGKRKLEFICITMVGEKGWYGTRVETS